MKWGKEMKKTDIKGNAVHLNKKIIVTIILSLIVIGFGAFFVVKHVQEQKREQEEVVEAKTVFKQMTATRAQLNQDIVSNWDTKDTHFVSAHLTTAILNKLMTRQHTITRKIVKYQAIQNSAIQTEINKQQAAEKQTNNRLKKLQVAFAATQATNKLFTKSVISGSEQTMGVVKHDINNTDISTAAQKLDNVEPRLKKVLLKYITTAKNQLAETRRLKIEIEKISVAGKLKDDVTLAQLDTYKTYLTNLKYPELANDYQSLNNAVDQKISSLSVKNMNQTELYRRISYLFFGSDQAKNSDPTTYVGDGKWEENKYWAMGYYMNVDGTPHARLETLFSIQVQPDGSYIVQSTRGGDSKTGNLISDISAAQLATVRADASKPRKAVQSDSKPETGDLDVIPSDANAQAFLKIYDKGDSDIVYNKQGSGTDDYGAFLDLKASSKSMQDGGGTGAIGFFRVYNDGTVKSIDVNELEDESSID